MIKRLFFMSQEEYDRLNPPILETAQGEDGKMYIEYIIYDEWFRVGYIPRPITRLGWFVYHFIHGLAMRYRFLPVFVFSIKQSFMRPLKQEVIYVEFDEVTGEYKADGVVIGRQQDAHE